MSAANAESPPADAAGHRASFFRQSGWLMIANVGGGALMYGVHLFAKVIPEQEYALYGALLALTIFCVPQIPLQMVCAQQAAAALASGRARQLAGMFRAAWLAVTGLWLLAAAVMWLVQDHLLAAWGISQPAALWITMLVILVQAWLPMFLGLLQGKQDFLPFGWAMILNGVGRLAFAALVVLTLASRGAAGIMTGALAGLAIATGLAMWNSRDVWSGRSEPYDRRAILKQVVPLLAGFCACQFLMAADTMIVTAYLKQNAECYVAAGTLSRALIWAVGPLTSVMFPRIVHSSVRGEKSNIFGLSLAFTAGLAVLGVLGLWLLGPLVVRLMAKPSYVAVTTQLLPWYAAAMVPLCLANVLASNLLGRADFRVVPPMIGLALAYGVTLLFVHGSFLQVLQLLGLFNFLLFAVCGWFTLRPKATAKSAPAR